MVQKTLLVQKTSARRSYANGYKYCSRCRVYHLTDGVRCPYCGILLRNSPRKKKPTTTSRYVRIEL
jgi:rRNA maturation endonuclease Nob1